MDDEFNLGGWSYHQRQNKDELSDERLQRLNELDFIWDPHGSNWEKGYEYLIKFKQQEGHCEVPQKNVVDGFQLGHWLDRQFSNKKLPVERIKRLADLGIFL